MLNTSSIDEAIRVAECANRITSETLNLVSYKRDQLHSEEAWGEILSIVDDNFKQVCDLYLKTSDLYRHIVDGQYILDMPYTLSSLGNIYAALLHELVHQNLFWKKSGLADTYLEKYNDTVASYIEYRENFIRQLSSTVTKTVTIESFESADCDLVSKALRNAVAAYGGNVIFKTPSPGGNY